MATGPAPTAARVHAHFPGPGRQQEGVFFSSGNRWAGRIPRSNSDKARSPQGSPAHQRPSEERTSFRGERQSPPLAAFDLHVRAGGCLTGRREATGLGPLASERTLGGERPGRGQPPAAAPQPAVRALPPSLGGASATASRNPPPRCASPVPEGRDRLPEPAQRTGSATPRRGSRSEAGTTSTQGRVSHSR